jgi:uncharacterized protein YqeY
MGDAVHARRRCEGLRLDADADACGGGSWLHLSSSCQLRGIKAVFQGAAKDKGLDSLPDEECIAVLRKLSKQRTESIEAYTQVNAPPPPLVPPIRILACLSFDQSQRCFTHLLCVRTCADVYGHSRACTRQAGRDELAAAEKSELDVINSFLPALADEATTRKWVEEAIAESGATSPSMMGKVFVPLPSLALCPTLASFLLPLTSLVYQCPGTQNTCEPVMTSSAAGYGRADEEAQGRHGRSDGQDHRRRNPQGRRACSCPERGEEGGKEGGAGC